MNKSEKINSLIRKKPKKARRKLGSAFRAISVRSGYFPKQRHLSARELMVFESTKTIWHSLKQGSAPVLADAFLPCEILIAMGFDIIFPEGFMMFMPEITGSDCRGGILSNNEDEDLPAYQAYFLSLARLGVLPKPLFIARTSFSSFPHEELFNRLEKIYDVPVFKVTVPLEQNEASVADVKRQLQNMAEFCGRQKGEEADNGKLKECMLNSFKTVYYYKRYMEYRADKSLPTDVLGELLPLFSTGVLMGKDVSGEYSRVLMVNAHQQTEKLNNSRILCINMPVCLPAEIRELLDNPAVEIVACSSSYDRLVSVDPSKPYESMAKRLVFSNNNARGEKRLDVDLKAAAALKAHGAVYFNRSPGADYSWFAPWFKKEFEATGIKAVFIDCALNEELLAAEAEKLKAFLNGISPLV